MKTFKQWRIETKPFTKNGKTLMLKDKETNKLVGTIDVQQYKGYAKIEGLYVETPYRGKGYSYNLYDLAKEYAKENGLAGIISDSDMRFKDSFSNNFWKKYSSKTVDINDTTYDFIEV